MGTVQAQLQRGNRMALNASALGHLIDAKLQAAGFKTVGQHAHVVTMSKAIAEAVVEHITAEAEVSVTSGSSSGTYKVT